MVQRGQIILQNYLKTRDINNSKILFNKNNNYFIYYKRKKLFYILNNKYK